MATLSAETCLQSLHLLIDSKAESTVGPHRGDPGCPTTAYNIKYAQFNKDSMDAIIKGIDQLQKIVESVLPIDFSITLSSLYDSKHGMLVFLQKTFLCKELEAAVTRSLKLMALILTKLKSHILLKQISDTRELMLEIGICVDSTSKGKEFAFDNLILIVGFKRLIADLDDIRKMLNAIHRFAITFSNPPQRTFRRIFEVMGLICKQYKEDTKEEVTKVEEMLLACLETQASNTSANFKPTIVEGCIKGIGHIMAAHPFNAEQKRRERDRIYRVLKSFLDTQFATENSTSREQDENSETRESYKGPQLAGLSLLAQHGSQLSPLIYDDYLFWHKTFQFWVSRDNSKLHQIGYQGLSTFYFIIGQHMKGRCDAEDREKFDYFMGHFKRTVLSIEQNHTMYDISLSIQGYGDLSGPCAGMMQPREVKEMFSTILQRAEEFLKCTKQDDRSLVYLPKYLQALGTIVSYITSLGPQYQATLQCLFVLMFEIYPTLPIFSHHSCIEALLVTFDNLLTKKGSVADSFISEIVYQSMIRTCSHTISSDAELMKESLTPYAAYMLITYDRFLPEWEGILNINTEMEFKNVSLERRVVIAEKILCAFLQAIIKLVEKLDLGTTEKKCSAGALEEGAVDTMIEVNGMDPETCLEATKPKDFTVFINMVDLVFDILPRVNPGCLMQWMDTLLETLIVQAIRQPLISGFNKLLTLCLNIFEKTGYYKDIENEEKKCRKYQCYQLLGRFLRDALCVISQYKGDLLLSSLRLLMAAPLSMVPGLLLDLGAPFRMALKLGLSYLPIASDLIETLFKWQRELPPNTLLPLLEEIVPLFDRFLHGQDHTDSSDAPVELVELQSRRNTKVRVPRRCNEAQAGEKDTALASLQRQILLFLAQLDSPTCMTVVKVEETQIAEEAISWSTKKVLKFDLPFAEMKPSIYLDDFLPLVSKMALTYGDRQARISACEMLHSAVLCLLGQTVQVNVDSNSEVLKLLKHIFPTLINLGCDSDVLVRQLFEPLVLQIIHFQTSRQKIESHETNILIDTIMDGITHAENVALRDFSAMCLKEFVTWAHRQSRDARDSTANTQFAAVVEKICLFSKHPCQFKRAGSALAINSLYSVLREKQTMDERWLEILYYMVTSLMFSGSDEQLVGTTKQTLKAIEHIERILKEKSSIFNMPSEDRIVPSEFNGGVLKNAIEWLLKKCSSRIEAVRSVCQQLVSNLAVWSVQGATSSQNAVASILENTNFNIYIEICEGTDDQALKEIELMPNEDIPIQWLNILLGCLDCYVWLLSEKFVSLMTLFPADHTPEIFKAVHFFCETTLLKLDSMDTDDSPNLTIREAEQLEALKCRVVISILKFLNKLLEAKVEGLDSAFLHPRISTLVKPMWGNSLWKIVSMLTLEPGTLAFSLRNRMLQDQMLLELRTCLQLLPRKLPVSFKAKLFAAFNQSLADHANDTAYFQNISSTSVQEELKSGLIDYADGFIILKETELWLQLDQNFLPGAHSGIELMKKVFDCLFKANDTEELLISPVSTEASRLLSALLKLAFSLGVEKTILFYQLLKVDSLEDPRDRTIKSIGSVITAQFKPVLLEYLLKDPCNSICALVNSRVTDADDVFYEVILGDKIETLNLVRLLMTQISKSPALKTRYGARASEELMKSFDSIISYEASSFLEVVEVLTYIAFMLPVDSEHCKYLVEWVSAKLKAGDKDLGVKRRCLDLAVPILNWHSDLQMELISALRILKEASFPIKSGHLVHQSSAMISYKAIFSQLLVVMQISKSECLLEFIASVSCCDPDHVCKEEIQESLAYFTRSVDAEKQEKVLKALFKSFQSSFEVDDKMGYIEQFMLPMLQSCNLKVLTNFFAANLTDVWAIIKDKFEPNQSFMAFRRQMVSKTGCFKIIEVMYGRLNHSDFQKEKPIGDAFPEQDSLNKSFTKAAYSVRTEKVAVRKDEENLYQQYQCSAYNTLVAIICCLYPDIQDSEQAKYSDLLFASNQKTSNWAKIVDCSQNYTLRMDFEKIPQRKSVLVNIRTDARTHRRATRLGSYRSQTVQYIASQQLFDSSLSEDVTKFDLSNVSVMSFSPDSQGSQAVESQPDELQQEVYLEMDTFNQHPCMPILCALVRKLGSKVKTSGRTLPKWMQNLLETMRNADTHPNVKVFLTKLIINTEDVFKQYAEHWLEVLCSVINNKSLGKTVNYMITDTVSVLLNWHNKAVPDANHNMQKIEASNLLLTMMEMSCHRRRDVMKFVLELVKTMVEVWKAALAVNYQFFYGVVCESRESSSIEIGLQLTAILLANKRVPWNVASQVDFISSLLEKHLMSTEKRIRNVAAENLGILLNWAFGPENQLGEVVFLDKEDLLNQALAKLRLMREQKNIFYETLHTVHRHYPPIVDTFMNRILHNYPQQIAVYKTQSLDMICNRLEVLEEKWRETTVLGLERLIVTRDETEQILAIKIVTKMLSELTPSQALTFVKKVSEVLQDSTAATRDKAYELYMQVFNLFKSSSEGAEDQLKKLATSGLVSGLSDQDPALQKKVLIFWRENAVDNTKPLPERFVKWMEILFVNESANLFVGSYMQLLLEELTSSPDYNRKMFEHALGNCEFQDMPLLSSWRTQHATMQPLFVKTQTSQIVSQTLSSVGSVGANKLLATQQSLLFEPTLEEEAPEETFNASQQAVRSSSLLVSLVPSMGDQQKSKRQSQLPELESHQPRTGYRFYANEKMKRTYFAKKENMLKSRRSEVSKELKRKREGQVKILRKYRAGDIPDIQIPLSAVLKPLQVLAKQEPMVAKTLWVSLFAGICSELKQQEEQYAQFLISSKFCLKSIVDQITGCVPLLVGAILEISYNIDLEFDSKTITEVCAVNGLVPLGCLLLEEYIADPHNGPPEARRPRLDLSEEKLKWLKLAELYQLLEERDVVLSIIKNNLKDEPNVDLVKAVEAESSSNWSGASKSYKEFIDGINVGDAPPEYDFSLESYFKCLEKLSDWGDITDTLREVTNDKSDDIDMEDIDPEYVWKDGWNQEKLLPWFLKTRIFEVLEAKQCADEKAHLVKLVTGWLEKPERLSVLKNRFSEEISLVHLIGNELEKSRFYSRMNLQILLEQWSVLSNFLPRLRAKKLGNLQCVAEIISYNEAGILEDQLEREARLQKLCERWMSDEPHSTDSLLTWTTRAVYRSYFADRSKAAFDFTDSQNDTLYRLLRQMRQKQELAVVDLAIQQNNTSVAAKFLQKTVHLKQDPHMGLHWNLSLGKCKWLVAQSRALPQRRLQDTCNAFKTMHESLVMDQHRANMNVLQKASLEGSQADIAWYVKSYLEAHEDSWDTEGVQELLQLLRSDASDADEVKNFFEQYGRRKATKAINDLQLHAEQGPEMIDALMRIVHYSKSVLSSPDIPEEDETTLREILVKSLLDAMKFGSREARMLFPSLLQLDDVTIEISALFISKCKDVPEWMFLGWLNQILAYIDTEKVTVVKDILLRVGKTYKNALLLPFHFTKERLASSDRQLRCQTSLLIGELEALLAADELTTKLMNELCCIKQPEIALIPHIKELHLASTKKSLSQLKTAFKRMCLDLYQAEQMPAGGNECVAYADVNQHIEKIQNATDLVLRIGVSQCCHLEELLKSVMKSLRPLRNRDSGKIKQLSNYSEWLASFQACKRTSEVEIPGQYTGDRLPNVKHHVKFSTFNPDVKILVSKQKPVLFSCVGNNGRNYEYIMKAGEDLRQDERIQLLFGIMNNILDEDQICRERQLNIKTYRVVPITTRCGMIHIVPNCKTLLDFTGTGLDEKNFVRGPVLSYENIIRKHCKDHRSEMLESQLYRTIYLEWSEEKTKKQFCNYVKDLSKNMLKNAFKKLSSSNEAFFWLRQNFVSSLATMSVAHWLLGIGDRHRSNMLICQKTGVPIGIDFGHAFGSATELLSVPELMPFRLTEHFVELMGPMGTSGTFRATMIHVLKALKKDQEILLQAMNVFIQEPSMDWKEQSLKLIRYDNGPDDSASEKATIQVFAKRKIHMATIKFNGMLPPLVTEEDLMHGPLDDELKATMVRVIRGNRLTLRSKLRVKAEEESNSTATRDLMAFQISPDQQVDCLIEQATDTNILGKTYYGWEPFC